MLYIFAAIGVYFVFQFLSHFYKTEKEHQNKVNEESRRVRSENYSLWRENQLLKNNNPLLSISEQLEIEKQKIKDKANTEVLMKAKRLGLTHFVNDNTRLKIERVVKLEMLYYINKKRFMSDSIFSALFETMQYDHQFLNFQDYREKGIGLGHKAVFVDVSLMLLNDSDMYFQEYDAIQNEIKIHENQG